ncbi:MAG: cell wall-binding repeat-containing protein [Actinomycetota bacterium]|jgi:TolB protein|nr:cell wall-binding repeat-containing protein [Actinomycetota bacterium]
MRRTRLVLGIVLVVGVGAGLFASSAHGIALLGTERRLTDENVTQLTPDISGDKVVWLDYRDNASYPEVYVEDLVTGNETRHTTSPSSKQTVHIDGDLVVWSDYRNGAQWDIYAKDLVTGVETRITNEAQKQLEPEVSGDIIVWQDQRSGNEDIYAYNMTYGVEIPICTEGHDQFNPSVSGDIVVWMDMRDGNQEIYAYDMSSGIEWNVTNDPGAQVSQSICGDIVAWYDTRLGASNVRMKDLSTGVETWITSSPTVTHGVPHVSEQYITWVDWRNGSTPDMFAYDLDTGNEYEICTQDDWQDGPAASGGDFVWYDDRNDPPSRFDIYEAETSPGLSRSGGLDRYATAVEIARDHPTFRDAIAIIATGEDFPDALSAAGLAGIYQAPLFLVRHDSIPDSVKNELLSRNPSNVIIVGGPSAVGDDVYDWLDARFTTSRISGADRYATSRAVADSMAMVLGTQLPTSALIARGDSFPDALALAPISYAQNMPILLVRPNAVPSTTAEAIQSLGFKTAAIAGGTVAVSSSTQAAIDSLLAGNGGTGSFRWAGADRYATSAVVAQEATDIDWANCGYVGVATGANFPDALAGGVACGEQHGVMLLVAQDSVPGSVQTFASDYRQGIDRYHAYGDTGVVGASVMSRFSELDLGL